MIEIGRKINGRYLILGSIGSGGMANVFLARDLILDREVAVKVLRFDFQNNKDAIRRFQREALAATELIHPNIVAVYDVGEEDGMQYLVMEYVRGMDLKRYIQTNYPIPYMRVVDIMQQILSAVAVAHQHRIIHRDLKPQNILIDEEGVVKITDFGIAIALTETSITQTNTMLGSVHYLSPEQARGSMATNQSDIYALGIILFEMLTGQVPFDGESAVTIALKHFQETIPEIRSFNRNTPQSLENVVLKATTKEPADRYKTVNEMYEDLATVLQNERLDELRWQPSSELQDTIILTPIEEETPMPSAFHKIETPVIEEEKTAEPEEKAGKKPNKFWLWAILASAVLALSLGGLFVLGGGRNQVMIPNLEDKTQTEAVEALEKLGLTIEKTEEIANDKIEKGRVVKTNPAAGTSVKKGRAVILYLSSGTELLKMPSFIGKKYEDAKKELIKLQFNDSDISQEGEASDTVPAGEIISQDPEENEEVDPKETKVVFVVSTGKEAVSLPSVEGDEQGAAVQSLRAMGFSDIAIKESFDDSVEKGQVIKQSPAPGTLVSVDTTITLTISKGQEEVTVPDLVNMTEGKARSLLSREKLVMNIISQEYSDIIKAGSVISSTPQEGEDTAKGGTVDVILSKGPAPKTVRFTVNVRANYKEGGAAEQTITVWVTDENHNKEQVDQVVLTEDDTVQTIPVAVQVLQGEQAVITVQRDNGPEVSQKVSGATTVQVP